jgi:hypothetical protein
MGGGVGGGKVGMVCAAPIGGGGMIGTKSGKNTALLLGVNVNAIAVSVVL